MNFLCAWFSHKIGTAGKAWNLNASLNAFLSFLRTTDSQNYWKHQKNVFLVQRYRHLHHLSLQLDLQIPILDDLCPACQEAFHDKIVIDYNKIMKSSGFRHLCDNLWSKKVTVLCFVKFVALVLYQRWKKITISKKLDLNIFSSNESKHPAKKKKT